jgi:tetraacyldisaccharide 4'-kinase
MAFQVLRAISRLYQFLIRWRKWAYRSGWLRTVHMPVPVVVVGNVVAGGAGKTPTVVAVVEHLTEQGWRVGVISRGYGRQSRRCELVHAQSRAHEVGDEPLLVFHRCRVPVVVAAQRVEAANALLQAYPQTNLLISDDGLQHLALGRALEILVFDDRGIGNGELLPAGWLREPWPRPADLVLHTGSQAVSLGVAGFTGQRRLDAVLHNGWGHTCSLYEAAKGPVAAFAGIAHPERFFAMLRQQGLPLVATQALPDHADLSHWQAPDDWPSTPGLAIICTEKDAYKVWEKHPQVWSARLNFEPEPAFFSQLDRSLASFQSASSSPMGTR